ncbi:hypothetical protein [Sorangium sp. So ce1153]|uniref:hypothetical protein n=1 Tax=Sorangium sp. So ce1153 TaxID=3133333 RepID=UPI003F5FDB32
MKEEGRTKNMKLSISLDHDGSVHLRTIGEVFTPPLTETSKPEVSDVNAQKGRPSRFVLQPGVYEYHFHVDNGSGAFTVAVTPEGTQEPIASKQFDTKYGFAGKVLRFEVGS